VSKPMKSHDILPHEPEEELLTAEDVAEDVATLERIIAEKQAEYLSETAMSEPSVWKMISELVSAGICRDEEEVIARAVESFFVAVFPKSRRRIMVE